MKEEEEMKEEEMKNEEETAIKGRNEGKRE